MLKGESERDSIYRFLVRDVDLALGVLTRNLDFEPLGAIALEPVGGVRRVAMAMTMPHGATLELIEPQDPGSEAARYFARWGPGPFYTRIGVAGLEAKAEDLRRRGTGFELVEGERRRLRVDPAAIDGALLEFVDLADAA